MGFKVRGILKETLTLTALKFQNIVLKHDHFCKHKGDVAVECGNLQRLAPFAEGVERDFLGRYQT